MSQQVSSSATPKKDMQVTLILFGFIIGGIVLFMLAAVFISQNKGPLAQELTSYNNILTWAIASFSIICLLLAKRVFKKGLTVAKNSLNPLKDKLARHRSALIRYLVICEVPVLLSILFFIFTGNFIFQVFAAVVLGFMLAMMPIRRRVVAELELDAQEEKELE